MRICIPIVRQPCQRTGFLCLQNKDDSNISHLLPDKYNVSNQLKLKQFFVFGLLFHKCKAFVDHKRKTIYM